MTNENDSERTIKLLQFH
jgi:hypothetical protein